MVERFPEARYEARRAQEVDAFAEMDEIHDLPPIYDYWSARYCLPLVGELGFPSLEALWDEHVADVCRRRAPRPARFVSLGAGNGEIELGIAHRLANHGVHNLDVVLLELNPRMLERARAQAQELGLSDRLTTAEADLNSWQADGPADVYFASHSLHHVVELEHLLDQVQLTLADDGVLLVNDMIGRNGHRRWPEAAMLIDRIWGRLPERYRYNAAHQRVDEVYPDVDCSTEGFEGIRAQDILPLLLERFHPDVFVAFMNLVDPFVDRLFGRNLDPAREEDRRFIDLVAQLDDAALELGVVSPTHLIASFRKQACDPRFPRGRSPELVSRREPPAPETRDGQVVAQLEARLAEKDRELEVAWGHYNALRRRKSVRFAVRLADIVRHPLRSTER